MMTRFPTGTVSSMYGTIRITREQEHFILEQVFGEQIHRIFLDAHNYADFFCLMRMLKQEPIQIYETVNGKVTVRQEPP